MVHQRQISKSNSFSVRGKPRCNSRYSYGFVFTILCSNCSGFRIKQFSCFCGGNMKFYMKMFDLVISRTFDTPSLSKYVMLNRLIV